jgi:hypothetical protein
MRALVLYKLFTEQAEEVYAHTAFSKALSSSPLTPFYKTLYVDVSASPGGFSILRSIS